MLGSVLPIYHLLTYVKGLSFLHYPDQEKQSLHFYDINLWGKECKFHKNITQQFNVPNALNTPQNQSNINISLFNNRWSK